MFIVSRRNEYYLCLLADRNAKFKLIWDPCLSKRFFGGFFEEKGLPAVVRFIWLVKNGIFKKFCLRLIATFYSVTACRYHFETKYEIKQFFLTNTLTHLVVMYII